MLYISFKRILCFVMLGVLTFQVCGCTKGNKAKTDNQENIAYFFDLKDSDASFLRCRDYNILINGGDLADGRIIYTYLRNNGINHIDLLICTNSANLIAGSFPALLDYISVGEIYTPNYTDSNEFFLKLKSKADMLGIEMKEPYSGEKIDMGDCQIEFFVPSVNKNDVYKYASLMVRVQIYDKIFLFAAGAEPEEQQEIIEQGFDLKADVLKMGFWLSENELSIDFLKHVLPKYTFLSVGDYPYDFKEIEKNTDYINTQMFRTDEIGDVIVRHGADGIELYNKKNSIRKEWKKLFSEDKIIYENLSGLTDAVNKYLKRLHKKDINVVMFDEKEFPVGFLSNYAYVRCLLKSSNNKNRECAVVLEYIENEWKICGTYY